MIGGLKGSVERAMRYGWSEMMIENVLELEYSSRDTILAILREADDHWNVASHHRISTRPTELELVNRHCDVEQTKKNLECVVHTNEVKDSVEAQRSQEIGYVMLSHRAKSGMASMPPMHDTHSLSLTHSHAGMMRRVE